MNWGIKITIAFISFAMFILYMISKMLNSQIDLVDENYYKKELQFQNTINQFENTMQLKAEPVIFFQDDKKISLQWKFPKPHTIQIWMYYPANKKYDKYYKIDNPSDSIIQIYKDKLKRGKCTIKLEWKDEHKDYYYEKNLLIN